MVEARPVLMNGLANANRPLGWRISFDDEAGEVPIVPALSITLEGDLPGIRVEEGCDLYVQSFEVVVAPIELADYPGQRVHGATLDA
jgi:hypothetical protein